MVKHITKFILSALVGISVFSGCNNDILGIFVSNDLDDRLSSKNVFNYLTKEELEELKLGDSYSFVVFTDTHIEGGDDFGLEKIINEIDPVKVKFAVNIGDITQNGTQQDLDTFLKTANAMRNMGIPCYPVIGNHDVYFGNWPYWKGTIGSTSYRVDGDTATLFILDTANSFFGKAQLDWLEREIKIAKGRVFVFTHSTLFVEGPVDIQQVTDIRERSRVISILQNKCDIMFMGHLHKRIIRKTGNVQFVAMEDYKSNKVYCLVDVTKDGITYEFKKVPQNN